MPLLGRSDERLTRLLVTGASGLLGSKLVGLAIARGHDVYAAYKDHQPRNGHPILLEQIDEHQVTKTVSELRPHVIINTAALTDVDSCEARPETAFLLNATSVGFLADAARKTDSFLVQVSTDYVFNGDKGGYSETDSPSPINQYGLSKLKGEQEAVKVGAERCCIARASVVYGWGRVHRPNAATYVYDKLAKGEKISMVVDQHSSPTLNTNLAGMILEIAERRITGVLHTSGATRLNRYEFAVHVSRAFGLDIELISPIRAQQLTWKAKRPRDSALNVTKASRTLLSKPLPIDQALGILSKERTEVAPSS